MPFRCLTLVLAILCAYAVSPVRVSAQETETGTFVISPELAADPAITEKGFFVYELEAKDKASGRVLLRNPGDTPVTVAINAVDATTAQTGGSAFVPSSATPTAIGTWVQLAAPRVTLAPGAEQAVDFAVKVPASAKPGQYLAGIAAYAVDDTSDDAPDELEANQAGAGINLQTRYVIAVQVDVPGRWTPSLAIVSVEPIEQPSGTSVGITLRNDGDAFLKPTGSVTLTNAAGATVLTHSIQMGTFVTGTEVTYPVAWPGGPTSGIYEIRVDLSYGDDQTAIYEGSLEIGATTAPPSVAIGSVTVGEVRDRADDRLQYVDLTIAVENHGPVIDDGRLSLVVTRDGEPVETTILADALTLAEGTIEVRQRYLPPTGWEAGAYAFAVVLEAVDPSASTATTLATATADQPVTVD